MKTPDYRWVCSNCEKVNEPNVRNCAFCGLNAQSSMAEIENLRQTKAGDRGADLYERVLPSPIFNRDRYWSSLKLKNVSFIFLPFFLALVAHAAQPAFLAVVTLVLVIFSWPDAVYRYIWAHDKKIIITQIATFLLTLIASIATFYSKEMQSPVLIAIPMLAGASMSIYWSFLLDKRIDWEKTA